MVALLDTLRTWLRPAPEALPSEPRDQLGLSAAQMYQRTGGEYFRRIALHELINGRRHTAGLAPLSNHFHVLSEAGDLQADCVACREPYVIDAGAVAWYDRKNLALPRRCEACRAARRPAQDGAARGRRR